LIFAVMDSRAAEINPRRAAERSTRIFWRRFDIFGNTALRVERQLGKTACLHFVKPGISHHASA
jgi:hypothetical protein